MRSTVILIMAFASLFATPIYISSLDRMADCDFTHEAVNVETGKCEDKNTTLNHEWIEFWNMSSYEGEKDHG